MHLEKIIARVTMKIQLAGVEKLMQPNFLDLIPE